MTVYGENAAPPVDERNWIATLWARYRPSTGWGVFWLTLAAVVLLPASLVNSELFTGLDPAVTLSIVAFVLSWWLANTRLSGPAAAAVLLLAGVAADLLWGVFVLRPVTLLSQLGAWWSWALSGRPTAAEPVITYFREQGAVLAQYLQRVGWWIKGLIIGPGAPDNLAVIGLIVLLCWGVAAWAAWWVARRGQPLAALLPTGVLLAQIAFWAPKTVSYVLMFMGTLTFLLVLARLVFSMRTWDATGVDYAEDIRLDSLLTALALTVVVTIVSPVVPFFASGEFSQRFWGLFESPWRRVEQQVGASFQVAAPVRSLVPPSGAAPGGLPRAHLLGAGPQLGREIALRVRVRGDPSNLQLYWRGQTYDTYTGSGWENAEPDPPARSLEAGQPWDAQLPSTEGRRPVVAAVEAVKASRQVLYAVGEPVGIDRAYQALLRGPGDLIALTSPTAAATYTALSYVPEQNVTTLRATGMSYPADVVSRYLQLPDNLDPRLVELSERWTAGAQTPYDKAAAIEAELRKIPYSLDVPTPPQGRELVSWFLFDLKRGYCDYYASAMIVLARLNGIPARLAIGYATGDLDRATGQYVVTEAQAHSWPELYFPGIGWVPFEPTAYLPPPERRASAEPSLPPPGAERGPEDLAAGMAEIRQSAAVNAAVERREAANRGVLTAGLGAALLWAIWLRRKAPRPIPSAQGDAVEAFERLASWGSRLGQPLEAADTLREYAGELGMAAEDLAGAARWRKARAAAAAQVVRGEALELSEAVERRLYGPAGVQEAAPDRWVRLWAALRELWAVKVLSRRG